MEKINVEWNKINELAKQYKEKKDKQILTEIFVLLKQYIERKATYIFYIYSFKYKDRFFKLVDINYKDLSDVIQELNLEVLRIINEYNIKYSFENYFNNSFTKIETHFFDKNLKEYLDTQSAYQINNKGKEFNLIENTSTLEEINIEFRKKLTEKELKVWELLQGNLNLTQKEIAEELGICQKNVSLTIASIKKKLQK